ncbi:MAG: hypothetical protein AAF333_07560 [Planctomycetota bacterium]
MNPSFIPTCVAFSLAAPVALAVDGPFVETYTNGFDIATPIINGPSTWTSSGGQYTVDLVNGNGVDVFNTITDSVFTVDNAPLGVGSVITTSVDFTLQGASTDVITAGFILFGTGTDTSAAGGNTFYEVTLDEPGGFVIPGYSVNEVGGADPTVLETEVFTDGFEGAMFNFSVVSTITAADMIDFEITLTGGGASETQTFSDTIDTALGNGFGLTGAAFSESTESSIVFDNFTVDFGGGPAPLTGDYDGNGFVGQSDLDLVLLNWGDSVIPPEWVAGDQFDGGLIGQNELDGVLLNWGDSVPPTVTAVPEPASFGLLTAGTAFVVRRTRRLPAS